ncbi:MAG: Gfo/Idh/MocA family oxidoreductase [Deltaproteobacteria bacterium]|nr:Gfo/Idh/MocA family oxidoreductase [Deltaproteobacteria bacterium]MBT4087529.1 Gfo/Idh/MocA family oxidoreductase [Deltaproteobacteria bacterium]MBT4643308.1 Gfo/Idh/MocA family oxidoreductase [Deltaproteobacteria bacterium]MBT7712979.1 Gfo/Idh/MocA family oxidoreductase [Deltaproteobacteria bacterium]
MKKIRFAIVGCGDAANDIGLISRFNRKLEVVACVDTQQSKGDAFARKHRIPQVFTDYDVLLAQCELDVIYLAVPHYLHYPMIQKAMKKGLHVFCEKPITIQLDHALELCRQVKQGQSKIGVNYQYRYDKACYALARASHKGELGEIYYIRCNVPWSRKEAYFRDSSWHASKEQAGGGTLITQASHIVDIALWITNSRPQKVTGLSHQKKFKESEVEDIFMGTIETAKGIPIQLCSSMVATPERCPTIEVYGSKGTGIYKGHFFPKVTFLGPKLKKEKPPVGGLHAMVGSLEGFRRWIAGEMPYEMPIQNSLEVLATVEALYRAAESGQPESVDQRYLEFV